MTSDTKPLVPAEVDLTDFPFMPIMIARLKQSRAWLVCKRKPELAFYMINLWTASWHGKPAGSIEDDDLVLADLAMCSSAKVWDKIKAEVLRGWVRCSDGRIYHSVVAEHALEAWSRKSARRDQTEAARIAREAARARKEAERLAREAGTQQDSPLHLTKPETISVTDNETEDVSRSKGQRQGQGQGEGQGKEIAAAAARGSGRSKLEVECRMLVGEEPVLLAQDFHVLEAMLGDGLVEDDIRVGIREALERSDPQKRYRRWESFAKWCRTAAQNRLANGAPRGVPPPPVTDTGPRIDFGNSYSAPYGTIRNMWSKGNWLTEWGPRPDEPGCRIRPDVMSEIMGERVDA